jgi:hypothetical protein
MLNKLAMSTVKILRETVGNGACTSKSKPPILLSLTWCEPMGEDQRNKRTLNMKWLSNTNKFHATPTLGVRLTLCQLG